MGNESPIVSINIPACRPFVIVSMIPDLAKAVNGFSLNSRMCRCATSSFSFSLRSAERIIWPFTSCSACWSLYSYNTDKFDARKTKKKEKKRERERIIQRKFTNALASWPVPVTGHLPSAASHVQQTKKILYYYYYFFFFFKLAAVSLARASWTHLAGHDVQFGPPYCVRTPLHVQLYWCVWLHAFVQKSKCQAIEAVFYMQASWHKCNVLHRTTCPSRQYTCRARVFTRVTIMPRGHWFDSLTAESNSRDRNVAIRPNCTHTKVVMMSNPMRYHLVCYVTYNI